MTVMTVDSTCKYEMNAGRVLSMDSHSQRSKPEAS